MFTFSGLVTFQSFIELGLQKQVQLSTISHVQSVIFFTDQYCQSQLAEEQHEQMLL